MTKATLNSSADLVLKYLSLLSVFLIIDGVIYNILFYEGFNIEITNYIEVSEILMLFIPIFKQILIASFPFVIGYIIVVRTLGKIQFGNKETKTDGQSWSQIIFSNLGALLGTTAFYFICNSFLKSSYISDSLQYIFIYPLCYFSVDVYNKYQDRLGFNHTFAKFILINVIVLLFNSVYLVYTNIQDIRAGKGEYETALTLKTGSIKSSSQLFYLGQCKNYIFLYDLAKRQSTVLPKSEVLQIQFSRKK